MLGCLIHVMEEVPFTLYLVWSSFTWTGVGIHVWRGACSTCGGRSQMTRAGSYSTWWRGHSRVRADSHEREAFMCGGEHSVLGWLLFTCGETIHYVLRGHSNKCGGVPKHGVWSCFTCGPCEAFTGVGAILARVAQWLHMSQSVGAIHVWRDTFTNVGGIHVWELFTCGTSAPTSEMVRQLLDISTKWSYLI